MPAEGMLPEPKLPSNGVAWRGAAWRGVALRGVACARGRIAPYLLSSCISKGGVTQAIALIHSGKPHLNEKLQPQLSAAVCR